MAKRIIFMGTPEFAVPSLEALIRSAYQVVAVYTQPDRKAGRGQVVMSSPVKQLALLKGLKGVQPESLKAAGTVEGLCGKTSRRLKRKAVPVTARSSIRTMER